MIDAEHYLVQGIELDQQGKWEAAAEAYRQAIQRSPELGEAYNNLGNTLVRLRRFDEAIEALHRAVQLLPSIADIAFNLGSAYLAGGDFEAAEKFYRVAIQPAPDQAKFHHGLGNALSEQGQLQAAVDAYRQSCSLNSNRPQTLFQLGTALQGLGQLSEAQAVFQRAIEQVPNFAEAYYNLGNTFRDQGDHASAAMAYRHAMTLRPGFGEASLVHQLQTLCRWDETDELAKRVIQSIETDTIDESAEVISPFLFLSLPIPTTAEQQWRCARKWCIANRLDQSTPTKRLFRTPQSPAPRLNIGYLSSDFRAHPVGYLIPELIESHDRNRFKIFGYGIGPADSSSIRKRILNGFDQSRELQTQTDFQAAKTIADDEIHILIDLNGYTQHARTKIMSLRPAPIQVNYLGFPGTMASSCIDCILVDEVVVPIDQQPLYAEQLIQLPGCYMVNDRQRQIASSVPSRSELGLPESSFVFCAFNASYKITSTMFKTWCRLLAAIPDSVLWLRETNPEAMDNLRREASRQGISTVRLIFAPTVDMPLHVARHAAADLFLDTFPYNQHSTASDALHMGLPVVTLCGETFASRVGASLLQAVGLYDLISHTIEEYESIAIQFANDENMREATRHRLKSNLATSTLFSGQAFAKSVEQEYWKMWEQFQHNAIASDQ
ncbi:MAG: tetratricopeptide repeat protein [Pirellulaceae bacterium]|nr:tetratricopeptide repeat protein [Pirellulaceae bacterium]